MFDLLSFPWEVKRFPTIFTESTHIFQVCAVGHCTDLENIVISMGSGGVAPIISPFCGLFGVEILEKRPFIHLIVSQYC